MQLLNLARLLLVVLGVALIIAEISLVRRQAYLRVSRLALSLLAGIFILFNAYLWTNHIGFPLFLEPMEGVVWQHFARAASFQPIYPQPSPEFVPLAYNPLYYVLSVPFSWLFGVNLATLRMVAILGMIGSGIILYLVVRSETGSRWWGVMAVGLYAAAYRVMESYLDTAHSDSWLLFSALLGSYLIYRNRSRTQNLMGVVVLVAAFWFKQHGSLFALTGLLYLTWRDGLRKTLLYWGVAILLGPVAYIFAGPQVFGPYFHYFTWTVPRGWSELNIATIWRYAWFAATRYPILAVSAGLWILWLLFKEPRRLNIWHFQFVAAFMSGLMGSLDPGSLNNIYIPMGMWSILCGTIALHEGATRIKVLQQYRIDQVALYITLAVFLFNPLLVIVSPQAPTRYAELVSMLRGLDGPVYSPSLGQLPQDFKFHPAALWVALEDLIRGPNKDTRSHPGTQRLLDSAVHPDGPAYILTNSPLTADSMFGFLTEEYVLDKDLGDTYEPLRVLPRRWDLGWPRYLYRYAPTQASP